MPTLQRVATCGAARDDKAAMVDASLASDDPYQRDGYSEILVCSPQAVNLARARDGLPLLMHHDRTQIVGRAHGIRADGHRVRGQLMFFDTTGGCEAAAMVRSGHRELSVGYTIDKADRTQNGDLVATRWTLLEVSIVAIPADAGIGIARSFTVNQDDTNAGQTNGQTTTRSQRRQGIQDDRAEGERVRSITAIARSYSQWVTPGIIDQAVREGHTVDEFNSQVMGLMRSDAVDTNYGPPPALISQRGDPQDLAAGFSLSRAIMAQVDPAAYLRTSGREKEVSQELSRNSPLQSDGLLVPFGAFFSRHGAQRDMTAGASGSGGAFVQTSVLQQLIDVIRARSAVIGLGAHVLPGLTGPVNLPRKTVATSAGSWLAEVGDAAETNVGTDAVALSPKRIGAFVEPSRQLMITSSVPIETMIRNDLQMSLLAELDRVALLGTGSSNQPRGLKFAGGIGAVIGGVNGALLSWEHVLGLEAVVDNQNGVFEPQTTGYLINSGTRSYLKRTPRHATLSLGMIMGDAPNDVNGFGVLNGYRVATSSKVPNDLPKGSSGNVCSLLAFGDWSQMVIGLFGGGVEIIVDPYTLAKSGQIRITANLFGDVGVRVPGSFVTMEDAKLA